MQDWAPSADDEDRRRRRARRRIYESLGVTLFMAILLLGLWLYVQSRTP